jgi:hypothetical protein
MTARAWVWLGVVALAAACTKSNPNYCAEAGAQLNYSCEELDAAVHSDRPVEQVEAAGDSAGEAPDSNDAASESPVDGSDASEVQKPICSSDNDCAGADAGTPACDTTDAGARCVECTADKHCPTTKPVCDTTVDKCVECTGLDPAVECQTTAKPACDTMTQTCVQCVDDSKCGNPTPICDAVKNTCRPCTADSECKGMGPEICVDWDGHCATNAEVAFLDRGGTCDASVSQYCTSSSAVSAITAAKSILLITGTMPVSAITIPADAQNPILILGRGGASVGAGVGDNAGIEVDGPRKAWVRDIKISGGTLGLLASGSELHLTRATIVGNATGGVLTRNVTGFDVTSSIIANNGQGDATGGIVWAGVRLGDVPAGGLSHFENNTVFMNAATGVSCSEAYSILASVVYGNSGPSQIAGCMTTTPCCGTSDPLLDATYHLMSTSPCIDKLTATMTTPATDVDGQPFPTAAGKLDCGADQYVAP